MASSSKDYTNGRIYKILNYIDNEVYVGSTCQSLSKRMAYHRNDANKPMKQHRLLYTKLMDYGIENFYIELIETYPCENMEELRKREGHYIREVGSLNKRIEGRTHQEYGREYRRDNHEQIRARVQEYREANRELIYAQQKEYREVNRDTISKRRTAKYSCVCGSTCRFSSKAEHLRTKKHQDFITNLDATTQTES